MTDEKVYKNAVLDDKELQDGLEGINSKFGDFVTRVAGEAWSLLLIDQKTKALITLAVDVVNQDHVGSGNPFLAHVNMALKQGVTHAEIEELFLFMCVYAGFNKVAGCFGTLNQIFEQSRVGQMISAITKADYAIRDRKGKLVFYVLLWKKKGIKLELFDDYWRNVHGPVCARLPGQHQYWQFHLAHNQGDLWPVTNGIDYNSQPEEQFDGIAELTFETEADRQTWFQAATVLMDDEHNLFSKAIGYNTSLGNSKTYVDAISTGDPNGELGILKFHVMVKKSDDVSVEEFRKYITDSFASAIVKNDLVLKFRLHLFEEVDNSRPDAAGVVHYEPQQQQYQAAFEIAFSNSLEMRIFWESQEYATAVKEQSKYVKEIHSFPERSVYTFVYNSQMTLAGQRSSKVAELIAKVGATNQLQENIVSLMSGKQNVKPGLGHYLQGMQHVGVTVQDMEKSLEFYLEVLGGKLVLAENGLMGDGMQNTLFQKEEIDAILQGIDPQEFDIPNLRGEKDALDIKFISFGNTCIELIYFRDAAVSNAPVSSKKSIPSHIGNVNAMHISFHVKDDIDLNYFAKMLEEECQRRGLTNVVFNRVIRVKSAEERRKIALKYNSNKFWNEPDLLVEGQPEADFGEFEGWALFYCKGPNGEQLEFNQVTRKAKEHFDKAQEEYKMSNSISIPVSNEKKEAATAIANLNQGTLERLPGTTSDLVKRLFSRGEAFDAEGFITFFTDTPVYQFGNFEVCLDKAAIKKSVEAFFSQISAVYHDIKMIREIEDVVFVEMDVIYWRKDGSVVTLPCCNIFRVEGDNFSELRIFMDVNPVFNPGIFVPPTASVFTISQGKILASSNIMRKHFAEHPEGKKRVEAGFVPKWSINGPKWSIGKEDINLSEQLEAVLQMSGFVLKEDWEQVKHFLTDDIFYKVGSSEAVYGKQAVVNFLSTMFATTAKFIGHEVRKVWQEPGIIVVEMDAKYITVQDQRHLTIACCDIYRLRGNQVSEWRVYADILPFYETTPQKPKPKINGNGNQYSSSVNLN
jgi:alkylhydroperoxidase/carboxymuconolactone decarboxylase family protein YurZ/limonene-1,2-epoxide hydrolase/catechol 2,3-dioxygenase-like lactoylglutathione lyase family enzyme